MLGWSVHRPESNRAMVNETYDIIMVRNNPLNLAAIVQLSRATLRKMIPKLLRATGGNTFGIPLATRALCVGLIPHPSNRHDAYGTQRSDCGY
jgi:cation transport ATPase